MCFHGSVLRPTLWDLLLDDLLKLPKPEGVAYTNNVSIAIEILDDAKSYVQHAIGIGERASAGFGKMSRVSSSTWGVRYHALRGLFSGTYVAILTYAAAVWYQRSSVYAVRSALLRTQ